MFKIPAGEFAANVMSTIRTEKVGLNKDGKTFSKVDFAEAIGYDRVTIIRIETGKRNITKKVLEKIADTFDKEVSELLPDFLAKKYINDEDVSLSEIEAYEKGNRNIPAHMKVSSPAPENEVNFSGFESMQRRILSLEEERKRLIAENERLINIVDKLSGAVSHR